MPFKSEKQRRFLWTNHPEIARRWSDKYGGNVPNKGGNKGSTGAGKGFSTHHQVGTRGEEDSPGWDPRTQGDRRYGKGATLPGGKRSKRGNISRDAIMKRLSKSGHPKRKKYEDEGSANWTSGRTGGSRSGPLYNVNQSEGDVRRRKGQRAS